MHLTKNQKDDATNAVKAAKNAAAEKKATVQTNAKSVGKELKDTANAVKTDAIETGKSVKEVATK